MSTQIIESDSRVFEVTLDPDTPGHLRRTLTIRQLSGEPLTADEWRQRYQNALRDILANGGRVHGVKMIEGDEPDE